MVKTLQHLQQIYAFYLFHRRHDLDVCFVDVVTKRQQSILVFMRCCKIAERYLPITDACTDCAARSSASLARSSGLRFAGSWLAAATGFLLGSKKSKGLVATSLSTSLARNTMPVTRAFVGPALAGAPVGRPRAALCGARPAVIGGGSTAVRMGLNAKSMTKGKGKGGKGKGKKGGGGGGGAPRAQTADRVAQSKGIDTNKKEYIYQMQGVSKTLGNGKKILDNINLSFFPRVRIGVLGPNGAGKSTLLKIMAGVDTAFDGIAVPQANAKIGYLPQVPVLPGETVDDVINEAVHEMRGLLDRFNELSGKVGDESLGADERERLGNEWARVQDEIEARNGWELDRNVERALDALRCAPGDAKHATLSGGEQRRVALCALLLRSCDLLILDEPTNHLDAESVLWLERFLETFNGTVGMCAGWRRCVP